MRKVHSQPPAAPAPADTRRGAAAYAFDGFDLDVGQRTLGRGDATVALPSRAFDVLVYLIRHRDRHVHKDELIAAIWNDVVVTDDSLIHAISVLRRELGDERHRPRYIQTIPRRGYRFIGSVRTPDGQVSRPDESLRSDLLSQPGTAPSDPARRRPTSRLAFPRSAWPAALGGALVAIIAVVAFRYEQGPVETGDAASIRLFQPAPPDTDIISGGVLSPDGRYLLFVARDETLGEAALWVRALHSSELDRLEGTSGASKPFWSPDSERIAYFANGKLLTVDVHGGKPRMIATVFAAAGGSWGPDDTILFAEWASGIFVVPASGDGEVRMVSKLDRAAEDIALAWPQFFPDGERFLYQVVSLDEARSGVYVGDLATAESYKLLDTTSSATLAPPHHLLHVKNDLLIAEELDPDYPELTGRAIVVARGLSEPSLAAENVVSASADLLAFQNGVTKQHLAWRNRDGEALGTLAMPTVLYNPRISPDGTRLVGSGSVTTDPGLWLVSLEREEFRRLETDAIGPVWSPDGERVAFTNRNGFDLLLRAVDDTDARRTLTTDDTVKILNEWSPDGRKIIYTKHEDATGLDLWTIDVDTGIAEPLLATPHSETQARISPDGQWIAYASDETGLLEIYVARFPSLDDERMVSEGGGGQPAWRSDQKELFYLSLDRAVMSVGITAGDTIGFETPRRLFRASTAGDPGDARDYFAVGPDGSRFLIDSTVNANDGQAITIMVNWAAGMTDRRIDAARLSPDLR